MGVVGPVIATNSGMVTADDKMRATVVPSDEGVQHSLPWSGVAHRHREHTQQNPFCRITGPDERFVARQDHARQVISALLPADQRLNEKAVRALEGYPLEILVCPVRHVAGLEAGNGLPATLRKDPAGLDRRQLVIRHFVHRPSRE